MKSLYQKTSATFVSVVMMIALTFTHTAAAAEKDPQSLVEGITKSLFSSVKTNNATVKVTDAYIGDVEKILDSVVDFPFIAKNVMRKSAPNATPEQIEKFNQAFKAGLIKTYAKGIANYADSQVKTLPAVDGKKPGRASVDQEVSAKGATHKLSYSMMQNKAGEWKLINVVLNGVNLGESFTSQFDQAMIRQANDVDKVIANWLSSN